MMPEVPLDGLTDLMSRVFVALGTPLRDADLVARELSSATALGIESHGVLRFPWYVEGIRNGRIVPGAAMGTVEETETTAVLDCAYNFGQVAGYEALRIAVTKAATHHLAAVVTRRCNHTGRLGAYADAAADLGLIAFACGTTSPPSHMVVPFGGLDGRLGTNPIAYAAPTLDDPILADFATCVASEGKARMALRHSQDLPEAALLDADGTSTRDPAVLYSSPTRRLLPLGGGAGYKGTALAVLAELLAGMLAGEIPDDADRPVNGLFLLVIDPSAFLPLDDFKSHGSALRDYIRSSRPAPGHDRIIAPGDLERSRAAPAPGQTISLDPETWQEILDACEGVGVRPGLAG
jgi:uncharacterized oxidoreductase